MPMVTSVSNGGVHVACSKSNTCCRYLSLLFISDFFGRLVAISFSIQAPETGYALMSVYT